MKQIAEAIKRQDIPNQQNQETGSPDLCDVHNIPLHAFGHCVNCESEQRAEDRLQEEIKIAYSSLELPARLQSCTFENYKPSNPAARGALEVCKRFAKKFTGGGLVMLGSVGTGKTHLAVAICQAVCKIGKRSKIATVTDIIREVRSTWKKKDGEETEQEVIRRYSLVHLLVIDEIGSQYGTDSEKILVSEIINNRYNNMLPTIAIGNVTLSQATEYLGERAIDRIKHGGNIIVFDWESYRKEGV